MTINRKAVALIFLLVLLAAAAAGCSRRGVHMPKHRKRRHCDCPTFAMTAPIPSPHASASC